MSGPGGNRFVARPFRLASDVPVDAMCGASSNSLQHFESVMARISYIEEKAHPELAELIGKVRSGRRGTLINVYKLLLHAPPLAESWLNMISTARFKTELDGRLREIAIIRVAYLNRTEYVVKQHVPELSVPEGLPVEESRGAGQLAGQQVLQRARARGARLRGRHDARHRRARRGVRRAAAALFRAADRRTDRADRHLQHAHPRVHGARHRSRTAPQDDRRGERVACPNRVSLVVEDDRFLRVVQVVLDPNVERTNASPPTRIFSPTTSRISPAGATRSGGRPGNSIRPRCGWSKPRRSCAPTSPKHAR